MSATHPFDGTSLARRKLISALVLTLGDRSSRRNALANQRFLEDLPSLTACEYAIGAGIGLKNVLGAPRPARSADEASKFESIIAGLRSHAVAGAMLWVEIGAPTEVVLESN